MIFVFWVAVFVVVYTYLVYPAAVWLVSRFRPQPSARPLVYSTISVVMPLYNEQAHVARKIENLLSCDYPRDKMEILIGSDGSTDETSTILRDAETRLPVSVCYRVDREGKPAMLNRLVAMATGDLVVFTDARQRLDVNALKELVRHFGDAHVGSVSAELHYEAGNTKPAGGVGLYWKYETYIRKCESRLGSMLGATGALYAIRRHLFVPVPQDLILDDVYVPLKVVEQGCRAILAPEATIHDRVATDPRGEFVRKTRTMAGNFQLLRHFRWALNPFGGIVAWQFLSHKVLRLFVPYSLVLVFAANVFLLDSPLYRTTLALQVIFYGLAAGGTFSTRPYRLLDVPHMFCVMNYAAVVGLYRFVTKTQGVLWAKTE